MQDAAIIDTGPPPPCPEPFNLASHALQWAGRTPNALALEMVGPDGQTVTSLTYGALADDVHALAGGFAASGVGPGDLVVLRLGNSPDFPTAFLALTGLGAVPVLTSSALTAPEFAACLAALPTPRAIFADADLALPGTAPLPARTAPIPFAATAANDAAYVVFTSGSSSRPKPVLHAHRALWARRMMHDGWYGGLSPSDRLLHAGAFNWTYTLGTGLLDPWSRGATALAIAGTPPNSAWPTILSNSRASLFAAVPGLFRRITRTLAEPRSLPDLRHALSAGEALPQTIRAAWQQRTGTPIFEALGMSEVSTFISGCPGQDLPPDAMGRPQPGRRIAALSPGGDPVPFGHSGELAVSAQDPGLMLGYLAPDGSRTLPLTNGWFATSDQITLGRDGATSYHARLDDVMTVGGYRIAPQDVEATLARAPGVSDIAVAAVAPNPTTSIIAAFVVGDDPVEDALRDFAKAHLAHHKQPRAYVRLPSLPRRGNGKLDRKSLPDLWSPNS